jgi:hypothetical protein
MKSVPLSIGRRRPLWHIELARRGNYECVTERRQLGRVGAIRLNQTLSGRKACVGMRTGVMESQEAKVEP